VLKGYEAIPTAVLKQLSELRLPLSKQEYTKRLNELLRGAGWVTQSNPRNNSFVSVPNGALSLGGRNVLVGKRCGHFPSSGGSAARAWGSASAGQVSGAFFTAGIPQQERVMVDRGNTDKHRTGITGNGLKGLGKVVETEKWGINTARERYGKMDASPPPPPDKSKPQFRTDQSMGSRGHIPAS
jgi:hypothetical protein